MNKKIAVLLDESGKTISFDKEGFLRIFEKDRNEWIIEKEFPVYIDKTKGIKFIREQIEATAALLDTCKVIVAQKVTGLPYTVLDMKGFNIWEWEGKPENFLEFVLESEEKDISSAYSEELDVIPQPQKINDEGSYFINLKKAQQVKGNFTSKQILLPFLKNNTFYQLDVICSHIPHWFEREFDRIGLEKEIQNLEGNEYKVTIRRKTCEK